MNKIKTFKEYVSEELNSFFNSINLKKFITPGNEEPKVISKKTSNGYEIKVYKYYEYEQDQAGLVMNIKDRVIKFSTEAKVDGEYTYPNVKGKTKKLDDESLEVLVARNIGLAASGEILGKDLVPSLVI